MGDSPEATITSEQKQPRYGCGTLIIVIIISLILLGIFREGESPKQPVPPPLPSIAEWTQKAGRVGLVMENGYIQINRETLFQAVGSPSSTQMVGDNVYLYWQCANGRIQLVASRNHFALNLISGTINTY